ncbi:unnamed protein product [Rotaria sp. Silwood1]|nr:unnamed protein product [Rotaria sp. Silwood1]CAF1605525.1 unnamed protein product [Rotaria sp. Silwood1]CAF3718520.1 unnamed protein product [Rotaria sp. Silwood1]CAF3745681.1 unnamed protein product [Rotaria sp. Silwood1]CAF4646738.1 unnamed protein product [Rotaria sp. Silwood1]
MSMKEKFISTATGASPPWPCNRDVGCSPIYFDSSIESMSSEDGVHSSIFFHQEKQSTINNGYINKVLHIEPTSSLSSSFCSSPSTNTTPTLSATSSMKSSSTRGCSVPSNIQNNRSWPVDLRFRRDVKYRQQCAQNNRYNYLYQNRTRITRSPMKKTSNNMLK